MLKLDATKTRIFSLAFHFVFTNNEYSYQKLFVVPQLSRRYHTFTKGVAVRRSSDQNDQPLKAATKTKLFLGKTISLCLATFIYFSLEMITYEISEEVAFISFILKNLILIIKHNGKVNFHLFNR